MSESASQQFATEVVETLVQAGYEALWAGGCVRDHFLGNAPSDFDVATNAQPRQVRQIFGKHRTVAVGESFGVIVVLGPSPAAGQIEVATFRTDGKYTDGRHPDAVVFSTAREDALRRDFTINGMFYDPLKQELLDYVGGQQDLQQHLIRAIGDPVARFQEDKLRMLRAIRFTARFGFHLERETSQAVEQMAAEISLVSQERITEELRKMFRHSSRAQSLELLEQTGLLFEILPPLREIWADGYTSLHTLQLFQEQQLPHVELSLAVLLSPLLQSTVAPESPTFNKRIDQWGKQLKLSNQEVETLGWLLQHRAMIQQAERLPLHRLKTLLAHRNAPELIELARMDAVASHQQPSAALFCEKYLQETPPERLGPPPLITGNDLIQRGMKPGREFAQILQQIREAQLDEVLTTPQEAQEWLTQKLPPA